MESEFTIQDIVPIAIVFVVVTIVLGFGASIVAGVQATQTTNSYAYNASQYGLSSLNTFASNMPLLATVVVAAVIITVLLVYLGGRLMGQ
jgi:uncharacterized membrane protein YjgN (DUF898 family)